jgi:hypothetical protein
MQHLNVIAKNEFENCILQNGEYPSTYFTEGILMCINTPKKVDA